MKIGYAETALDAVEEAPAAVRNAFWKKMKLLEQNLLHPSLHCKKYSESQDKWQGRVNRDWRFYFRIVEDTIIILDVTRHPK
jgi:mRNA-degrading endonuclease RelE of RelBE toxin-antitoxin system